MTYAVILAGGGGTRLWPLSTAAVPKPFLPLLGAETPFGSTVRRLLDGPELRLVAADVTVVAEERYRQLVERQAPGVRFLAEPLPRNTAAAITLATIRVERPSDEVMLVLPADHVVLHEAELRARLAVAARTAAGMGQLQIDQPLVTLGIAPDRPASEYGYLIPAPGGSDVTRLAAFEEKPDPARATALLRQPGVAWNAGMFAWQRRAIANEIALRAPDLWRQVVAADSWERIEPISIDYAVMQPAAAAGRVGMVRADIGWNDIGGWPALLRALGAPIGGAEVVGVGGTATAAMNDVMVTRLRGRLQVDEGPASFRDHESPVAILRDAARQRAAIEALVERVATQAAPARVPVGQGGPA